MSGRWILLEQVKKDQSRARIIFPSSRLVYKGVTNVPLVEESEKEFKSVYALNKWFGEKILEQYSQYFNIPFTIFRICVPYGNLFKDAYSYGTVGFFLNKASKQEPITLFGDGKQRRTFTHVEDICNQIEQALNNPISLNNCFNIGGESYSLREAAELVAKKFNVAVEFKEWPSIDGKLETGDTIFDAGRINRIASGVIKNNFEGWVSNII
jgi:UDP-glucose 4-epimerase